MSETTFYVKNLKGIKEKTFKWNDKEMLVFYGKNKSGKSSVMQALEETWQGKGFMKDPIKHGEKESKRIFKSHDKDGNPIHISVDIIEDGTYSFTIGYIKNGKMTNTSDPKKIKELMGTYYRLSVDEMLNMMKHIDTRRTFIRDFVLPILGDVKQQRVETLQLSISSEKKKATENNLYFTRQAKNKELETVNTELNVKKLSEEDKTTIASKEAVIKALNKLKEEKEAHKGDGIKRKELEVDIQTLTFANNTILNELIRLETIFLFDFTTQKTFISEELNKLITSKSVLSNNLYPSSEITLLEDKIIRGNNKLTEIATLEKSVIPDKDKIAKRDKLFAEIEQFNKSIESAKEEIKTIFATSSLPSGLQIDEEGTIILNGFVLDETTVSETETWLSLIELLCNLSDSEYISLGDWSKYDEDSTEAVKALAKKFNRTLMGQLVTNTELDLKTIIID